MQIAQRPRPKGPHAFYDQDFKRMERQGFKPMGWTDYHSSPYAEYERRVRQYGKAKNNNAADTRSN